MLVVMTFTVVAITVIINVISIIIDIIIAKVRILFIVCCCRIAFRLKMVLRLRSRTLTANALFEKCVVADKVPDLNCNCTF